MKRAQWIENNQAENATKRRRTSDKETSDKMNNRRLQIELDSEKIDELEGLMGQGRTTTKKDFVNAAFTLLEWAMKERKAGRIIASVDEKQDSYQEIVMPILSEVEPD